MNEIPESRKPRALALAIVLVGAFACMASCSNDTPDTLPPLKTSRDDLSYFPPGPEFKLAKQVQAIEEYKLRKQQAMEPVTDPPDHENEANAEADQMESKDTSNQEGIR